MNAIELNGVTWRYEHAEEPALVDVNLAIPEGDFVLVIGPNEAGKTTLVSVIKGLIPNSITGVLKGDVLVFGDRLESIKPPVLAKQIGFVFADPESQFTALTVEEEIVFGLENVGWPLETIGERVEWAARITGVEDLLDKPPYDISGGQKQRVAIASVIAMQPRILILDEPTAMIDPLGKDLVVRICAELKNDHDMTIVVVEHNIEAFAPLADKVVMVNEGRVERIAPPRGIFSDLDDLLARDVHPPQVTQVFGRLRERGLYHGELPLSDEEGFASWRTLFEGAAR